MTMVLQTAGKPSSASCVIPLSMYHRFIVQFVKELWDIDLLGCSLVIKGLR